MKNTNTKASNSIFDHGRTMSESGYLFVYKRTSQGKYTHWEASLKRGLLKHRSTHQTEKSAALAIDKFLIKNGFDPINILKKV